ncbi:MAG: SMI1/KNR4 family protein, partial [Actinobacteria bacterium]|nr:SMI1/KNR4 family protein [Actinomycetota bacterium]
MAQGDETADFGSGVQGEEIVAVEHYLGVKFPASYREFLKRVGWCSFGGREFYGITPGGVTATSVPSVVFATRSERQHGLPESFLVI